MIVGIAGNGIGAGKSTVAKYFEAGGYERRPFAKLLKDAVVALDPVVHWKMDYSGECRPYWLSEILEYVTLDEAKRTYPELRRLMQRMGTEVGRNTFYENFWVDQTLSQFDPEKSWVIDDVRFPNEAAAIVSRSGLLIFVKRDQVEQVASSHASEAHAAKLEKAAHIVLINGGLCDTPEKLHQQLVEKLGKIGWEDYTGT